MIGTLEVKCETVVNGKINQLCFKLESCSGDITAVNLR